MIVKAYEIFVGEKFKEFEAFMDKHILESKLTDNKEAFCEVSF